MKEKRKKKIESMLHNFIILFSQHGMDKTTIKMLADSMNCNEALLYQYFDDKDDMITKCTEYYHKEIQESLIIILCENVKNMELLGEKALDYIDSVMDTCRFLLQVLAHPEYSISTKDTNLEMYKLLENFSKEIHKTYAISKKTAQGIAFGINSLINGYILRPNKELFFLQYNALTRSMRKKNVPIQILA